MKTVLWATLTANGNYAQSSPEHPPKPETLGDFATQAKTAGNFIVGRRTFEGFQASGGGGGGGGPFASLDIVVVSRTMKAIPGEQIVGSPEEAVSYLQAKGHQVALVAGGTDLHNAFLGKGLVDELIFNIAPVLEGKGYNLLIDQDRYRYKDVQLLDSRPLGGGVVQLRFAVGR